MTDNTASPVFDFLEDDSITLNGVKSTKHPLGKSYTIPSPDAETGLRLAAIAEIATKIEKGVEVSDRDRERMVINDDDERDFAEQTLSPELVAELVEDGVSWVRIMRIVGYAYVAFTMGEQQAREAAIKGVFAGKVQAAPNRAARRATTGKGQKARQGSTATRAKKTK